MSYLPKETWKKILVISLYTILISIFLYIFFTRMITLILPFVISFFIALFLRPIYYFLLSAGLGKRCASVILTSGVYLGVGSGLFLIARKFIVQITDMIKNIISDPSALQSAIEKVQDAVSHLSPTLGMYMKSEGFVSALTDKLGAFAIDIGKDIAKIAAKLPEFTLFLLVTIISTYYFTVYFDNIVHFLKTKPPASLSCICLAGKRHFLSCSKNYILCMLLLLFITFIELSAGFFILSVPYAFSLSVIISLIDMLPILGVGTVLIPWSVICLVLGNLKKGIGLIILYFIITVIRQIIEPKIMGKGMGTPPFLTLIATYTGYRAFGFIGLISAPLICGVIYSIIKEAFYLVKNG